MRGKSGGVVIKAVMKVRTANLNEPLTVQLPKKLDVRILLAGLLAGYLLAGIGWLGFARTPLQVMLTVGTAVAADWIANGLLRKRGWAFPWSGLITGLGLSLLLNFGSHPWLPIWPAVLAIASKYIFTVRGKHIYNPGLFGLIAGMVLTGGSLSPAPAYQWGGSGMMVFPLLGLAVILIAPKIKRAPLLIAFLGFYGLQLALRAWVMRHHLPPEMLVMGTLASPPFFLFTFYMLTDPATSPNSAKGQVALAFVVTLVDLLLHFKQSYSTLFPALFLVQTAVYFWKGVRFQFSGDAPLWKLRLQAVIPRMALACGMLLPVVFLMQNDRAEGDATFGLERVENAFPGELGTVLEDVDPRIAHVVKWVLSVGDAVAVADVNGDGLQDVFLTYPLKCAEDRAALFLNRGDMNFERVTLPEVSAAVADPKVSGLPSCAVFADYDNDGDQDLFLGMGFGASRLFQNQLMETGEVAFIDVTEAAGISGHTTCVTAVFFDSDRDGDLDLLVGNAMSPCLDKYEDEVLLNPFDLPQQEYDGDRRMFHFMHQSWHQAENGGENVFYRNAGDGTFERVMGSEIGMPETHWTLALGVADFNRDGFPDLYAASDFGPDDVYLNLGGKGFQRFAGQWFGDVGCDTYKGMNVSVADFDADGSPDVYVSNVHAPLQAEGSLLWMTRMIGGKLKFSNEVVARGAVNERRFGWGAAAGDLDLNGWPDLIQANGMVDDTPDKKFDEPRDYWYVNGRLARTGPEVHAYADQWADMRGYSIWGHQRNRVMLNHGGKFNDAAVTVGLGEKGNARGVAMVDLDNDGDLDVVITHQFAEADCLRNNLIHDGAEGPNWIGVSLRGDGRMVSRDATGAEVLLMDGERRVTAWVQNVSGFSAQGDRRLVFALTNDGSSVTLEVLWPDGVRESFTDLEARQYHILERK